MSLTFQFSKQKQLLFFICSKKESFCYSPCNFFYALCHPPRPALAHTGFWNNYPSYNETIQQTDMGIQLDTLTCDANADLQLSATTTAFAIAATTGTAITTRAMVAITTRTTVAFILVFQASDRHHQHSIFALVGIFPTCQHHQKRWFPHLFIIYLPGQFLKMFGCLVNLFCTKFYLHSGPSAIIQSNNHVCFQPVFIAEMIHLAIISLRIDSNVSCA